MIPAGWKNCRLGDVLTLQRGFDLPERNRRTGNVPIVSSSGISGYHNVAKVSSPGVVTGRYGTLGEVFYLDEDYWPLNTTLYVRDFKGNDPLFLSYFHKVGVAPIDGVCSTDIIVIVPRAEQYFAITLCCVSSDEFVNHSTQTSQGTKMPRANWDVLVRYPIVLPPSHILSRFNEFVQEMVMQIQNMIYRNRNLRQTRDLLLPKLISGEVDVEKLSIAVGN